jgi:hypothetical protein
MLKRNVNLILNILNELEPKGLVEQKKRLYSTRSCVNWAFYGTHGLLKRSFPSRFKLPHSCHKEPNLHTNLLNKLLFLYETVLVLYSKARIFHCRPFPKRGGDTSQNLIIQKYR